MREGVIDRVKLLRAQRFAIHIPLRYRPIDQASWLDGTTENISSSGVLFRTKHLLDVQTPIEMQLELPAVIAGKWAGHVVCRGRIIRTVAPDTPNIPSALAAAILDYELIRPHDPRRI
jgi:hypothetical protein